MRQNIIYHECASPFNVSSITFIATNDYGTVSFSDVSSDVIPGYGPLLDNISMNQEYLYVDIDVDSNNDGTINEFDDSVEMAPNGGKILAVGYGQCKPINLSVHTSQTNLASNNIAYRLEYDNSKILLYNTSELPQAVYGTGIDISPYYIAPNTDLPNGFLTLNGNAKTIYVDGFVLGETTVTLKAYSVYQNSSGNTVRELISSDEIKLNVGFDIDTDSNEDGSIDSTSNFTLSAGKLSVLPSVEDMVEDLAGHGKTLIVDATEATRVEINTSEIAIPKGTYFQIIVSAGLNAWADASKTQRLTEVADSKFTVANHGCYQDDTIGEVYTLQANSLENIVFFVEASGFIEPTDAFSIDNSIISLTLDTVRRTTSTRLVTSDNQTLAHDTISFLCECQNVIFCGIDGTDTKEWLTGANAKREDGIKWNSHIRNLFVDINTKYKGYFYGPNTLGTDCIIIHDNALSMIEDMYTTSGRTAKIVIVGFSRGAMIAQWVANDLSDADISVEFVGLYDPVDMSIIHDTESVIASNIKNELIIGPDAFTGQPIFNPDYWYMDFDPVSIDLVPRDLVPIEVNGIPFIRMAMNGRMTVSSLLTNVERFNLNASHGAIGGMPGYNDQSENTVYARLDSEWFNPIATRYWTSYNYTLDVAASFHADVRVRTKCVGLGIYVRILEFDDYKFFSTNPVCL